MESKKDLFADFIKTYEPRAAAEQANKAATADERVNARNFALNYYRSLLPGCPLVTPENLQRIEQGDQYTIDQLILSANTLLGERFEEVFNPKNLEDIINSAPKENFVKNFGKYEPMEIEGNDWHNERKQAHSDYRTFVKAEAGEQRALQEISEVIERGYSAYVEEETEKLKETLRKEGRKERTIEQVAAVVALGLLRGPVSQKLQIKIKKSVEDRFNKYFENDSDKEKYARANVLAGAKKLMGQGREGYDKAAQLVYTLKKQDE